MNSSKILRQENFYSSLDTQDSQSPVHLTSAYDPSTFHPYDELPRSNPDDRHFSNQLFEDFNMRGSLSSMSQTPTYEVEWPVQSQETEDQRFLPNDSYYELSSSGPTNHTGSSQHVHNGSAIPRTWSQMYDSRMAITGSLIFGETSSEQELQPESCPNLISDWKPQGYVSNDGPRDVSRLSISCSPTMDNQNSYASPATFEHNSTPMNASIQSSRVSEVGDVDLGGSLSGSEERVSDEPYAKLIFRALLSVPNHSMVLQEIYQWFKDNTDKGKSASSGWRNSIRHNLSMNAAFRKTDRRISGDNSKKTSEWVLEKFAIEEGITPTTRYRVKSKKKARSDNPRSNRVEAGRKGGLSAGKRSHKQRSRDETPYRLASMATTSRHLSPSTPPGLEFPTSSPYFIKNSISFGDLDVEGVYSFDDEPVFYNDRHQYSDSQAQMWPGSFQC